MSRSLCVGFVGLGIQGAPMANMIARAGWPLTIWARRPEVLEPFKDQAVPVAASMAALAESSDLLCVCVANDSDVDEVVGSAVLNLAPGSVTAIHSTVLSGVQPGGATFGVPSCWQMNSTGNPSGFST
jgi:3-hydroxyisobutyrate dehydrogenase